MAVDLPVSRDVALQHLQAVVLGVPAVDHQRLLSLDRDLALSREHLFLSSEEEEKVKEREKEKKEK